MLWLQSANSRRKKKMKTSRLGCKHCPWLFNRHLGCTRRLHVSLRIRKTQWGQQHRMCPAALGSDLHTTVTSRSLLFTLMPSVRVLFCFVVFPSTKICSRFPRGSQFLQLKDSLRLLSKKKSFSGSELEANSWLKLENNLS